MSGLAIELAARAGSRAACAHDGAHPAFRLAHQPEAVAADVVHVRVNRRNRRRHRHHGFERIAALGQHEPPGFDGLAVRRRDDAATMAGGV